MDDGLKQRLIGAFVLLAFAVVFLPVIFDRERIEPVSKATQIPPPPMRIEPIELEKPKPLVVEVPAKSAEQMYLPDEKQVQTEEPEPVSYDINGVPKGWVLQIGSFRSEDRANTLRQSLAADGYAAYTRGVETDKGKMTRLFVGPKLDKNQLIEQKQKIEKKYKVNTILLKFEP